MSQPAGSFAAPEGLAGQVSAVGLALLALAALWLGALAPALAWYGGRAATLQAERQQVAHMAALAQSLPALRAAAAAGVHSADTAALLPGGSDAVAGAALQSALQDLATQAGTSLDSTEMLGADNVGALRRISVAVSITADWPALIGLLAAIDNAQPRCMIDDLTINGDGSSYGGQPIGPSADQGAGQAVAQDTSLQASFTVSAFRAGGGPDGNTGGGS